MRKVFISKNYKDRYTASSKAKIDVEITLRRLGFKNIGLPTRYIQSKFTGRIWSVLSNFIAFLRMPKNSLVFLQYPVNLIEKEIAIAKKRNNKVYLLVHDIIGLRENTHLNLGIFESVDVLIVHNDAMKKWLEKHIKHSTIRTLGIFDYIGQPISHRETLLSSKPKVVFAGNLSKAAFIDNLNFDNIELQLFGIGFEKRKLNKGVEYCGFFSPNELAEHINSDFGLVWDGDSIDTCSGSYGEYLKIISPHKLSMYLSLGMPVIVWTQSAMADFVEKNGVGLVIDDLRSLESKVKALSQEDYTFLKANAEAISEKLLNGYFLEKSLSNID